MQLALSAYKVLLCTGAVVAGWPSFQWLILVSVRIDLVINSLSHGVPYMNHINVVFTGFCVRHCCWICQASDSDTESGRLPPVSFTNHSVNGNVQNSWSRSNRQSATRDFNPYSFEDSDAGSGSTQQNVGLNGGHVVVNNVAGSRAPLPGFSSFVWRRCLRDSISSSTITMRLHLMLPLSVSTSHLTLATFSSFIVYDDLILSSLV